MDSIGVPKTGIGSEEQAQAIDVVAIRRARLKEWFAGRTLPVDRKSYLSALINGKAAFGDKAARGLERFYRMPKGQLDGPFAETVLTLGDRVKRFRKTNGLTQQQLAERVGVTQSAVAAWESGKREVPNGDNLLRLSEVLGFQADELIGAASGAPKVPREESQLLAAFRTLPIDKQVIAIKLVEALTKGREPTCM